MKRHPSLTLGLQIGALFIVTPVAAIVVLYYTGLIR